MIKILVIEDEELLRAQLLKILKFEDFDVIEAKNGLIGIQLAQEQGPDLVLCDVMMPELDGYGVLAALRQAPATATIPFIFTTAKASKDDRRKGMNLGADDYLTKPFTTDELLEASPHGQDPLGHRHSFKKTGTCCTALQHRTPTSRSKTKLLN